MRWPSLLPAQVEGLQAQLANAEAMLQESEGAKQVSLTLTI